jgi:catechol 2,3-dioxygenase-like lactoylglutathione lyase family enzyme
LTVSHIAITVSNIEVSKKFYIDNFGFTFVKSFAKPGSGAQFMYLEKDNFQIELCGV